MVAKVTHRTVAINVTVIRDRLFRGLIYRGRWMLKCYSSFWISVIPLSSMCSEDFESVSMLTDVSCVFPRCCFPSLILSLQFTLHLSWLFRIRISHLHSSLMPTVTNQQLTRANLIYRCGYSGI